MTETSTRRLSSAGRKGVIRAVCCLIVLGLGFAAMSGLAGLKTPPARQTPAERSLTVRTLEIRPVTTRVQVVGYGQARALDSVRIAPEVSGRIESVHPNLEPGETITAGERLFAVDEDSYRAGFQEAEAMVAQKSQEIERLKIQKKLDAKRLQTLQRNVELARAEFERISRLHRQASMATESEMDRAEQSMNNARERSEQLEQSVRLAPLLINEAEQALRAARARRDQASNDLKRCQVRAPFTGRLTSVSLEAGQYVAPGQHVLSMADDSLLEIHVSVDSREARRWLRFFDSSGTDARGWFSGLQQVDCRIAWIEDQQNSVWTGRLHRPVRFDAENRSLTVAVRLEGREASKNGDSGLPLVEGMFCRVSIPGKLLTDVYRIPAEAVSFENRVYLADQSRLKTVQVKVARTQDGFAYITEGLQPGDQVITTRLVDPLENALLDILESETADSRP